MPASLPDYRREDFPRRPRPVWFDHLRNFLERDGVFFLAKSVGDKWAWYVEFRGQVWSVSDNGGELQVDVVNGSRDSGIGYVSWGFLVTPATAAHRVLSRMKGIPVDYHFSVSEEDNAVLVGASGPLFTEAGA